MSQIFNLEDALSLLSRTPATLEAMLNGLPQTWIEATEGEGTWSSYDVIGHLIHGERTDWIPRARHILAENKDPFPAFDRMAQFAEGRQELNQRLKIFAQLRKENIAALMQMNLTDRDLKKTGMHPELGEVTLSQLLATWVAHDLDHIGQIARTMAKMYTKATGPWRAYLSILRDREQPAR